MRAPLLHSSEPVEVQPLRHRAACSQEGRARAAACPARTDKGGKRGLRATADALSPAPTNSRLTAEGHGREIMRCVVSG